MLKVTYPMIARHYGKSLRAIKYRAQEQGGMKSIKSLYNILDFYEKKRKAELLN